MGLPQGVQRWRGGGVAQGRAVALHHRGAVVDEAVRVREGVGVLRARVGGRRGQVVACWPDAVPRGDEG